MLKFLIFLVCFLHKKYFYNPKTRFLLHHIIIHNCYSRKFYYRLLHINLLYSAALADPVALFFLSYHLYIPSKLTKVKKHFMALLNKLKYKMKSSFSQTGLSSPYRQLGDREITCHILTTKYSPH